MTETEQLADIIALSVHAATESLRLKNVALEHKIAALEALYFPNKDAWDALRKVNELSLRVADMETKAAHMPMVGPMGQPGEPGPPGSAGKDADAKAIEAEVLAVVQRELPSLVLSHVAEAVLKLPAPRDGQNGATGAQGEPGIAGKDAPLPDLDSLAQKAAALIPAPKDGRDGADGKDAAAPDLEVLAQKAAALIPTPKDGRDGKDAQPPDLDVLAQKAAALIAPPKDGRDGKDAEAPDLDAIAQKAASLLPVPKDGRDGVGVAGALLNKHGELVLTLSDGQLATLGVVVGKDGEPGRIGERGLDGKDGVDGFGFDDFDLVFDEHKGYALRFVKGTQIKEFPVAIPFDAGKWEFGKLFPKGGGSTVKGSFFIAQEVTKTRPDDGSPESSRAWRMAVKGGKDGRPGKDGRDGIDA
jgi:hypothetical protein